MNFKPLHDSIIIKRDPPDDIRPKDSRRVIIPEMWRAYAEKNSRFGTVIKIGNDCNLVKEGDKILFAYHSLAEIDKKELIYLVREVDVLAVEEKDA